MSEMVDEKVVSLKFDNKQFEQGVSSTLSTLDRFKKALHFEGTSKGLENLSNKVKNVDMKSLGSSVETVRAKFSALDVFAINAMQRISNSAIDAGKRLVSAFTIDPIKSGFQEYETQMNAVQTIMANTESKGSTLEDVNEALAELNTYADKTIYNFTEMTRNIGTFTAAGVGLKESTRAIQGIANLAAVSGSNSQQASTAMYQLSQALANGRVALQDWNSVVNAGMGGEVFQTALKRTATQMGTNVDALIKKYGSFRESLTKGQWLTTEVLTETLAQLSGAYSEADLIAQGYSKNQAAEIVKLANTAVSAATEVKTFTQLMSTLKEAAQSGWTVTWQTIIGDFGEAKELFSEISNAAGNLIQKMSDSRNNLLKGAFDSGWSKLRNEIKNTGVSVDEFQNRLIETAEKHGINVKKMIKDTGSFEKSLKNGWLKPSIVKETLKSMTSLDKQIKSNTKTAKELEKVVHKVISGEFGNGTKRIKELTKAGYDYKTVQELVNQQIRTGKMDLTKFSDAQLKSAGYTDKQVQQLRKLAQEAEKTGTPINELIEKINRPSGRELFIDSFRNAFQGLYTVIKSVHDAFRDMFPKMTSEQLYNIIDGIHSFSEHLRVGDETADKLRRTLRGVFAILKIFTTFFGGTVKLAFQVVSKVLNSFNLDILSFTALIGDALTAFSNFVTQNNFLVNGLAAIITGIFRFIGVIRDLVVAFLQLPPVAAAIEGFKNGVVSTVQAIGQWFTNLYNDVRKFISWAGSIKITSFDDILNIGKAGFSMLASHFSVLGDIFNSVKEKLQGFRDNIKNVFSGLSDNIGGQVSAIQNGFNKFKEVVVGIVEFVKEKLGDNPLGQILTIAVGAALIAFLAKITHIAEMFAAPFEAIGGIIETFTGLFRKVGKAVALKMKGEALKAIAIAIGILAASLFLLTQVDQGRLLVAASALVGITVGLLAVAAAMQLLSKIGGGDVKNIAGLALLAVGILVLVRALTSIAKIDGDKLGSSFLVLAGLMTSLVIALVVLSKVAPELSKGSVTMLSMALSLGVMVRVLTSLSKLKIDNPAQTIAILVGFVIGLGLIAKLSKGIKLSAAMGMVGMVVAIKMFIGVIEDVVDLDLVKVRANIASLVTIFSMFAVCMLAASFAGKRAISAGIGMIGMSMAMGIMVISMKAIAGMDEGDIKKATKAIQGIMRVFALVIVASKFAGKNAARAGVMLTMMSFTMLILAGVMVALSSIDGAGLDRATKSVTAIMKSFAIIIAATAFMGQAGDGGVKMMTRMCLSLALMAVSLGALAMIEPSRLLSAATALGVVMGMFSLMTYMTKHLEESNKAMAMMMATIVVLTGCIAMLSLCDPKGVLAASVSIGILMGMFTVMALGTKYLENAWQGMLVMVGITALLGSIMAGLSLLEPKRILAASVSLGILMGMFSVMAVSSKFIQNAWQGMLVMAGMTAALGLILAGLCQLPMEGAIQIAAAVGTFGLTMSVTAAIISHIPFAGAAQGVAGLAVVIAGLAAVIAAFGALSKIDGFDLLIEGGGHILGKIAYAIGEFVGNIGAGLAAGITNGLPQIAENISKFGQGLQPFFNVMRNVDTSIIDGTKNLAVALLAICGAELLGALTNFITGSNSLDGFGEKLKAFADGLVAFSDTVKGRVDSKAVEAASNAGKMVTELASSIPNSGGLLGKFLGENDCDVFGSKLKPFAQGLVDFSDTVKGKIDQESTEVATNCGKMITELASSIPNSGGLLGEFLGNNECDQFGTKLKPFAIGLVEFSDTVKGKIDQKSTEVATSCGKMITELANTIPNSGGLLGDFLGSNDCDKFGEKLVVFGRGIAEFSREVNGKVDQKSVESAAAAGKSVVELANTIPKTGGLGSIFGDASIDGFGERLISFGKNFAIYANDIKGVDSSVVTATSSAAKSISELEKGLKDSGGWFDNSTTIDTFGEKLVVFGKGYSSFYSNISGISPEQVQAACTAAYRVIYLMEAMSDKDFTGVETFSLALEILGKNGVDGFVSAFSDSETTVSAVGVKLVNYLINAVDGQVGRLKDSGIKMSDNLLTGLGSKTGEFASKGRQMGESAANGTRYSYGSFYSAGSYAAQGFANGINAMASRAEARARQMARDAANAINRELDINSPSRVTAKSGVGIGEGLIKGMTSMTKDVKMAGTKLGKEAHVSLGKAISKTTNMMNDKINANPIISPVLDLSGMNASIDRLNGMIDTSRVMSVDVGVNNRIRRGYTNADVVNAINGLSSQLNELSKPTYNINGITYDDGSNVSSAVGALIHAVEKARRG